MKKIIWLVLLVSFPICSQKKQNDYKYILIPNAFTVKNEVDLNQLKNQMQLSLIRNGYKIFMDESSALKNFPKPCSGLRIKMHDYSDASITKINLELLDCNSTVVYTSRFGTSEAEDYTKSYSEAINGAVQTMTGVSLDYLSNLDISDDPNNESTRVFKEVQQESVVTRTIKFKHGDLLAKEIKNGYKLVDSNFNTIYEILETRISNIYIIKGVDGVFYKTQNGKWIGELYEEDGSKKKIEYVIKF